jgi:hypothetical protein
MAEWLFDEKGRVCMIFDGDRFLSVDAENLGWLSGIYVYRLNGSFAGWYERGVLYNDHNEAVAFIRNADGHLPSRPGLRATPGMPGLPGRPGKPGLSGVPGRSGYGAWAQGEVIAMFLN